MSICASANPFNSRQVTTAARRPAPANDERWVALNKNIFQDILNAILIQTTFSSASVGKRYLSTRPEVSLHSPTASPVSFTGSEVSAASNAISRFKEDEDTNLPAFESTVNDVFFGKNEVPDDSSNSRTCEALPALQDGKPAEEKGVFFWRGNGGLTAPPEVKERSPAVFGKPATSGEMGRERSKVGSEVVCLSRRREGASSAFPKVGAYDQSCLENSHLSVYCEETYVDKMPMMILGLRPYHPSDARLNGLTESTNNQMSLHSNMLKKCHTTEISVRTTLTSGLDPLLKSCNADSSLLADGRRDQYDKCATITDKFLPPPATEQRHVNSAAGGAAKNGQKYVKSMYHHQYHSENSPEQNGKSSMKMYPAEVQSNSEADAGSRLTSNKTTAATAAKNNDRKSSRDHSILTILGLLSSSEDDEDCKKSGTKSPSGVSCETRGLDKNRLLGIGVTVIGRSRWMAVDKCIVYDMIDQVLNGEREYFSTDESLCSPTMTASRCDVTRPQLVPSELDRRGVSDGLFRKRSHHLPRTQRNGSSVSAPCSTTDGFDAKRETDSSFEGDLKQNHDVDLPSSSCSSSSSSSSSTYSSSFVSLSSTEESPINAKPVASGENSIGTRNRGSPAAKDGLLSCKSLEGVSVLRSLLSDDPIDACHGPSVTEAVAPHPQPTTIVCGLTEDAKVIRGRANAADCSKMPVDELRRVKRSRHNSAAEGKKRRVITGHPSTTNDVLPDDTISSTRRCSVPAAAASTTPDRASKFSHSMKWKSSMLMRMRTEEAIENETDT